MTSAAPTYASRPLLLAAKGGGSAIVEALFALAGVAHDVEHVAWDDLRQPGGRLMSVNPLCEIPTLLLPDGRVLTESAAITLWLGDQCPQAGLVPPPGDPRRTDFLRWLVWLVAAVYPTFTYGDHPERFVDGEAAGRQLRAATDARRQELWRQFEQAVTPTPFLLGSTPTALDVYLAVMLGWRPGAAWFQAQCPQLHAVALRMAQAEPVRTVLQRNGLHVD
jgi:GST-like protein